MTLFHVNPVTGSYAALAVAIVWLIALIVSDRRAGVRDRVYPGMLAAIVLVTLASGPLATRLVD
jgi:MFS superfamily sulfate permease-like transporter